MNEHAKSGPCAVIEAPEARLTHVNPGQPDHIADQRDRKQQHVTRYKTVAGLRTLAVTSMGTLSGTRFSRPPYPRPASR